MIEDERDRPARALVVLHGAALTGALADVVAAHVGGSGCVARVVVPAVASSRPRDWLDADADDGDAERTLRAAVGSLRARGLAADGLLGDADPLRALEDGLDGFAPDEILLVTGTGADWAEAEHALWRARRRVGAPVVHVAAGANGVEETLRLVHACSPEHAIRIGAGGGFRDHPVDGAADGVLLFDRAVESVLADESRGIVAVEVPVAMLDGCELSRGEDRARRFVVPAETLNAAGHVLGPAL